MAWTKVQDHVFASGTGTSGSFIYGTSGTGANVTAGNLLVIMGFCNKTGLTYSSITDTFGDTWSPMFTPISDAGQGQTYGAWATIAGSGGSANTVSITYGGTVGSSNGDIVCTEWSGITGSLAQDGTFADSGDVGSPVTTPSYTPTVTGSLVFEMVSTNGSVSALGGTTPAWTNGDVGGGMPNTGAAWGWTTGALSALNGHATTGSGSNRCVIFGIQAAGSGGPAPSGFRPHAMPLGV